MKIKDWITKEVITIGPEVSVKKAFGLMKSMGIRHLPVVNKRGEILGMVTDRDLRRPKISDVFTEWNDLYRLDDEMQAEDVMVTPVITIDPDDTIRQAAQKMVESRIGAMPVVDSMKKMVGIITESDVLRAFVADKN